MASTFKNLTLRQIVTVARRYGLDAHDRLVLESAQQADKTHGKPARNIATGKIFVNWGTNELGYYVAEKLLDGYLCEETRVMRCDSLAAREFERNAYGD